MKLTNSMEGVTIVETEDIKAKKPVVLCGLPDIGLIGIIAVSHIIKELNMKEVGYVDSDIFPLIVVFHHGEPTYPVRVYQKDNLLAIFAETALSPESVHPLSKVIVGWAKEKNSSLLVSLGGIGVPNRIDIDTPRVYGASNSASLRESIKKYEIPVMEEGFLVGPYALMAKLSMHSDLPNLLLMAESYPQYPDPGAAAAVISALNKFVPVNVDTKSLIQKSEEIRLNARELMRKTSENMQKMGKSQEYELPLMYV
ncbi:MAG: proteasome assembly chaperone family protein [Candidatus Verstraetearchaeota archaeon]|nr:proteasome assembly chaperone family protein [Candidatus Verstraetearchaeota archaeon]